ncbi:chaperonin 10-like protein [Mycena floridula]|nr:chaperonin 10-like protein [Mycena floridula]
MSPVAIEHQVALVLHGPRDIRVENRPVWPPQRDQAQVTISSTGLCGSDLHYYVHARNGDFAVQSPLVLGHEAAGIVTAVGPGVSNVHVGQRVAIEPGAGCKTCNFCLAGRYNLCKNMRFCSSAKTFPHTDGTLQQRLNHPASVLHPIPDALPFSWAALAEPLCVLLHAASRAEMCCPFTSIPPSKSVISQAQGKTVLVFGVGTIGILACAVAKSLGASKVCAVDIDTKRLEFASEGGWADSTYCLPRSAPVAKVNGHVPAAPPPKSDDVIAKSKHIVQTALEHFNEPEGFDVIFECTGVESCIQMGILSASPGSKVMLIGMGSSNIVLPISSAAVREVDIIGSFRYAGTWGPAVDLLHRSWQLKEQGAKDWGFQEGGLGDVGRLITHRFALADAKKAFELMVKGRDEKGGLVLKVLVEDS